MNSVTSRPAPSTPMQSRPNGNPGRTATGPEASPAVPHEQNKVRNRAFEIFQSRRSNGAKGDAVSDWLQAEREVNGTGKVSEALEAKSKARGETLLHHND